MDDPFGPHISLLKSNSKREMSGNHKFEIS